MNSDTAKAFPLLGDALSTHEAQPKPLQELYLQYLADEAKYVEGKCVKLDSIVRTMSRFHPELEQQANLGKQREILGKLFHNHNDLQMFRVQKRRPTVVLDFEFKQPHAQQYCLFMENYNQLKHQKPDLDIAVLHNCYFIIQNMMPQFARFKIYTRPVRLAPLDVLYHSPGNGRIGSIPFPNDWLCIPKDESALVFAEHPNGKLDLALVIDRTGFPDPEFAAKVVYDCKYWLKKLDKRTGCDFYGEMYLAGYRPGYEKNEHFGEFKDALKFRNNAEWQHKKKLFFQTKLYPYLRMLRDHMLTLCAKKFIEAATFVADFQAPCELAQTYFTTFAASHNFVCSNHLDSDVGISVGAFGDFDESTGKLSDREVIPGGEFAFSGIRVYIEHSHFTTICWSSSKDIHGTASIGPHDPKLVRFGSSIYINGALLKRVALAWDQNASDSTNPFLRDLYLALQPRREHKRNELKLRDKEQRKLKAEGKRAMEQDPAASEAKKLRKKKK